MQIVKKIAGLLFTLLAVACLVSGLNLTGANDNSQSVLDSPEAGGRMLGTMIPVILFGVIGLWLLFVKKPIR